MGASCQHTPQEPQTENKHLAAIGATTAQLAHEIGNPLSGMHTTVQVLQRHLTKRKDIAHDLLVLSVQDLGHEISRLWSLLQDLRSLARPRSLALQPTNLATVVAAVLTVEAPRYCEYRISIEQDFPADLPRVRGDSVRFEQVILNLCKNAVEAMPQDGTLAVRAFPSGEQVSLEISDAGVGIPAGLEIFDLFTTTKPAGTGIGLAVVQQIVSAHGGTLSYTSTPGQGTTFTLTLPVATFPLERD